MAHLHLTQLYMFDKVQQKGLNCLLHEEHMNRSVATSLSTRNCVGNGDVRTPRETKPHKLTRLVPTTTATSFPATPGKRMGIALQLGHLKAHLQKVLVFAVALPLETRRPNDK